METRPLCFSVIIPTYNRPKQLVQCLHAIRQTAYPRSGFEVLVVDDGSREPLEEIVTAFRDSISITFIKQNHAGPSAARNRGAKQAQGQYLIFTDDDCLPQADWMEKLEQRFKQTKDCIIGGKTLNHLKHNPYASASQMIIDVVYAYYNADPSRAVFFASNNLALPKDLFFQSGGFEESFTAAEDREFCDRWRGQRLKMIYAPEVIIYHAHPLNLRRLWKQHFVYGQGAFRFHQKRARQKSGRFEVDFSFYRKFFQAPFTNHNYSTPAWILFALLCFAQIAVTAGFFWEGFKFWFTGKGFRKTHVKSQNWNSGLRTDCAARTP